MVNCAYHPDQPAVATCSNCGRAICQNDLVIKNAVSFCMICAAQPVQPVYAPQYVPYPQQVVYPQQLPYYRPSPPTNGSAITSLVTGIISIVFGGCYGAGLAFAIAALVTGIIARRQIKEHEPMQGSGMAVAGIVTGSVGILFGVLWILVYVFIWKMGSTFINNSSFPSGILY